MRLCRVQPLILTCVQEQPSRTVTNSISEHGLRAPQDKRWTAAEPDTTTTKAGLDVKELPSALWSTGNFRRRDGDHEEMAAG